MGRRDSLVQLNQHCQKQLMNPSKEISAVQYYLDLIFKGTCNIFAENQ